MKHEMRFAYKFNFSIDMFDAHKSPVLDVAQTFVNLRWFCRITWVSVRYEYQYSLQKSTWHAFSLDLISGWLSKCLKMCILLLSQSKCNISPSMELCAMHYKWYCHCHFEFRLVSSVSSWTKINKMKEKNTQICLWNERIWFSTL